MAPESGVEAVHIPNRSLVKRRAAFEDDIRQWKRPPWHFLALPPVSSVFVTVGLEWLAILMSTSPRVGDATRMYRLSPRQLYVTAQLTESDPVATASAGGLATSRALFRIDELLSASHGTITKWGDDGWRPEFHGHLHLFWAPALCCQPLTSDISFVLQLCFRFYFEEVRPSAH
jgi:hypothetical protein